MPAVPEDIQQQYDALQHCLYVLRRAHLEGEPDEPVKALASTSLVDMLDVSFEDPMIASVGIGPWLHYMEVMCTSECIYHCTHWSVYWNETHKNYRISHGRKHCTVTVELGFFNLALAS